MDSRHLIEPENLPLWTAVTFIIALLTLVLGLTNLYRTTEATVMAQVQIMELKQKIETISAKAKP
jgi:Sec-independent protein secretion pathway component TatC